MRKTRSQIRAEERKGRRGDVLTAVAAIVLGLAVAWIILSVQNLQEDLRLSNEARDALAQQVESLGQKPVAGPPGSRGEPGKTTVGARGPSGPPGPSGAPGKPAPTITPSPGPTGPAGPPGADSTVPGPTGPPGQDATGAPGQDGQDGSDGQDGTDGQNGAPPSEWTYTDQDGNTFRCVPVSDFDPNHPRYHCTQTSTAQPDPGPEPSPSPSQQPTPSDTPGSSSLLPLGLLERRRD
jgi:hypothetical protein